MDMGSHYTELKNVFDQIMRSYGDTSGKNINIRKREGRPQSKKLSAEKAQAIKDEVHAEETNCWTNHK